MKKTIKIKAKSIDTYKYYAFVNVVLGETRAPPGGV